MKSLANRTVFRLAYQGLLLLILTVLPKALLNATIIFNFHNNQNFSIIESWLIIISSLFLLALTYLWARKENLLVAWHFTLKDLKSVGWGFILIFLMGMIGSNLMLLTHGIYHDSLQRTLLNVPFLPLATVMLTASFSEELLFRTWLYSWIAPYKALLSLSSPNQYRPSLSLLRNGDSLRPSLPKKY